MGRDLSNFIHLEVFVENGEATIQWPAEMTESGFPEEEVIPLDETPPVKPRAG